MIIIDEELLIPHLIIVGIVDWLAVPAVVPRHIEGPALLEHPEAEKCLEGIMIIIIIIIIIIITWKALYAIIRPLIS